MPPPVGAQEEVSSPPSPPAGEEGAPDGPPEGPPARAAREAPTLVQLYLPLTQVVFLLAVASLCQIFLNYKN